jgi:RND superfamily putative drug exporter
MPKLLSALGRFSARHRIAVIAAWLIIFALFTGVTATSMNLSGGSTHMPSTAATKALTEAQKKFPGLAAATRDAKALQLVAETHGTTKVTDQAAASQITAILTDASRLPHVTSVTDPFDAKAPFVSEDRTTVVSTLTFSGITDSNAETTYENVVHLAERSNGTVTVLVGGSLAADSYEAGGVGEIAGIVVAFLILLLTLGTLLAAGANMLTALIGVGVGVLGVLAWSAFHPLDATAITLPGMLGLAVGIDYSLFILTRFKAELRGGRSVTDAVGRATGTAGTAVVFAGLTVIIALVGLWITQIPAIQDMGFAGAFAVLTAVLVALTLTPVLLRSLGTRVLTRKERRRLDAGIFTDTAPRRRSFLNGWGNTIARRPIPMLLGATIVLAILAIPFLSMKTVANIPGGSNPESMQRHAYDLVVDKFGGIQSPLLVLAEGDQIDSKLGAVEKQLHSYDNVRIVVPGQLDKTEDAALITVIPSGSPIDQGTTDLVHDIRSHASAVDGVHLQVTGETAIGLDMTALMEQAMIAYVAVIVLLSFILMIVMFRSLLVPLFATLGYLLSLGAALGALTAVFQWGWLHGIVQAPQGDPIMSLLPIILVGVLFGLAMDYQVFMMSRIREEYVGGLSPKDAIRSGFRKAGPVLVAAALIMTFVFAGFASSTMTFAAETAFGLMVGVLADAFLVRMIIVPSLISLTGRAAWWMPTWMQRLIPSVDTEGHALDIADEAEKPVEPDTRELISAGG